VRAPTICAVANCTEIAVDDHGRCERHRRRAPSAWRRQVAGTALFDGTCHHIAAGKD
jgi:hypothetical protein